MKLRRFDQPIIEIREARFAPDSWDAEARTIELTWTTGSRVLRRSWSRGAYEEELSLESGHVRMDRLNKDAPLLSAHDSWSNRGVIGVVERAWIENGEGRSIVRLSEAESAADDVFKIIEGTLRNVSVGYQVYTYEITERLDSPDLYRAVDWEPHELSIVPIPADMDATVRSLNPHMSAPPAPTVTEPQERAMADKPKTDKPEDEKTGKTTDVVLRSSNVISIEDAKVQANEAKVAERTRISDIRSSARSLKLEGDVVNKLIDDGVATSEARAALIDAHAAANKRDLPKQDGHHTEITRDENDTRAAAFEEVLGWRSNPERTYKRSDGQFAKTGVALTDLGRDYRYRKLVDIARACCEANGVDTRSMADTQIAVEAMKHRGAISSKDFSLLTVSTARRNLHMGYDLVEPVYEQLAARRQTPDFKTNTEVIFGGQGQPTAIAEYGEFKHVIEVLGSSTWEIGTAGAMMALSFQAIVNDDLGAFGEKSVKAGRAFRVYENIQFWDLVLGNPNAYDGAKIFSAARGNILRSGTGGDPDKGQYGLMRTVLERQVGLESNEDLGLDIRFVVGSSTQRTNMEAMQVKLVPQSSTNATPNAFSQYEALSSPRIDRKDVDLYFAVSDPLSTPEPAFIFSKLDGMEAGPMVEEQNQWNTLSVQWRWFGFLGFSAHGYWGWVCNDQNDAITIT